MPPSDPGIQPYIHKFPGGGTAAIIVPLIIGGALLICVYILWNSHMWNVRQTEMSRVEEEVRHDLIAVYRALIDNRPEKALEILNAVGKRESILKSAGEFAYSDIRSARLMLEGQAEFMLLCEEGAPQVERKFTEALGYLMRASGEMWEFGMMGRARARIGQRKYREAEEDLNILLAGNSNYGAGYYWRAMARYQLNNHEGARQDEERAIQLDSWPPRRNLLQDACAP